MHMVLPINFALKLILETTAHSNNAENVIVNKHLLPHWQCK